MKSKQPVPVYGKKKVKKFPKLNIKWKLILPWLYRKRGKHSRQVKQWMENIKWD